MKSVLSKLIASALAMALLFNCATQTLAATPSRNKGNVKYLSEVAVIEAENQEEADTILAELQKEANGSFEGMVKVDLNKGGKPVFLAYKTSTNVDDAITDLSVMNMNGSFTMGNYEQMLSEVMDGLAKVTADYRVIASEFAKEYAAGSTNAQTAYRQMNYYYVEENGKKISMGDYMLNFPASDESFSRILFGGNLNIVANLRSLMSMGIGGSENPLAERIAQAYVAAETDPSVYENAAYEKAAKSIKEDLEEMKDAVNNLEAEIEALESRDLDEDLLALAKSAKQFSLDASMSFLELLKEIPKGDTTLGDYIMNTPVIEEKELFPIAAAAGAAELLLLAYHSFYSLLLYDRLEGTTEELETAMAELEADLEPMSVYHGVQNDWLDGTIGVTKDAEEYTASSGKSFMSMYVDSDYWARATFLTIAGASGAILAYAGIVYLVNKSSDLAINKANVQAAVTTAQEKVATATQDLAAAREKLNASNISDSQWDELVAEEIGNDMILDNADAELAECTQNLNAASSAKLTGAQIFAGTAMIVVGVVCMAISIWQLAELYNKYEVSYTEIPDSMVHVVEGVEGDRFINYKNVPAYYLKDGVLKDRENDLNSYDGAQWVSLYYTKNYEAGHCLTASPDLVAVEEAKSGYSPVHFFGRATSYNTNSYCNRQDAEAVYLAFKYSTNQKSAVTDVPDVVGSAFQIGMTALAGVVGLGLGMALMAMLMGKGKKEKVKQ